MTTIALLRGINVAGARPLPMAELRALCTDELGLRDVRTYIASGNLFFTSDRDAAEDAARLKTAIDARWGYDVPVVTRTLSELRAIRAANPFPEAPDDKWLHVVFLDRDPRTGRQRESDADAAARVDGLDPDRAPGDRYAVVGREVYCWYANGSGRSKLTLDWMERQMKVTGTGRNWRTLNKLIDIAEKG